MPKMIATKPHTYDRRTIDAGEEFDVDDAYVNTLVSLGRATLKEGGKKKPGPMTSRKVEAEEEPVEADDKVGKAYKTRRLKADD